MHRSGDSRDMAWSPSAPQRRLADPIRVDFLHDDVSDEPSASSDPYAGMDVEPIYTPPAGRGMSLDLLAGAFRCIVHHQTTRDHLTVRQCCRTLRDVVDNSAAFWARAVVCPPLYSTPKRIRAFFDRRGHHVVSYRHTVARVSPCLTTHGTERFALPIPYDGQGMRSIDFEGASELGVVVEHCSRLERLDVSNALLTGALVEVMLRLTNLRHVCLRQARVGDVEPGWMGVLVSRLPRLAVLDLSRMEVDRAELEGLGAAQSLEAVDLSFSAAVDDGVLQGLAQCPSLLQVNTTGCPNVAQPGLRSSLS